MASLNAKVSIYSEVVVFDEKTKEVLACIPLSKGCDGILKNGIDFKLYERGTEPTFIEADDGLIKLNENATVYKNLL